MGLFGRKKKTEVVPPGPTLSSSGKSIVKSSSSSSSSMTKGTSRKGAANKAAAPRRLSATRKRATEPPPPVEPTMDHLPDLTLDLESAVETSNERPARALRMLFALSEHGDNDNRSEMVRAENSRLVPALLNFLTRCSQKSSEQYLTLLVLNNISIPSENKRIIGLEYGGARVFANLLCDDPSCHLMAIILVNLTFADAELRKQYVSVHSGIGLVESLAFALRIASLTAEEYDARKPSIEDTPHDGRSPGHRLSMLMAEDQRLRPSPVDFESSKSWYEQAMAAPSKQLYPETARWCLAALKNLTRPCKDATAAHILIKSGMFSVILQYLTISGAYSLREPPKFDPSRNSGSQSSSDTPAPIEPMDKVSNAPTSWDSNSMQDAALFIALNLSACPTSRDYIYEANAINVLSTIAGFSSLGLDTGASTDQKQQQEFQSLKARMALSYLVGSEGHFGQSKMSSSASTVFANPADSVLVMSEDEIKLLVELLANTLHKRGKDGPGGYSAATFSLKHVLMAIRCLLTHTENQTRIAKVAGRALNVLLVKVLALHSIVDYHTVDAEAAEYACFSLYLQSNYGFQLPFLPGLFEETKEQDSIFVKILISYRQTPGVLPAGRHAADQLLRRMKYMMFAGTMSDIASPPEGSYPSVEDMSLEDDIMTKAEKVVVGRRSHGAKPNENIFDRPILRSRKPGKGNTGNTRAPWDNRSSISVFPSALQAVQQLSYGSTKVRHVDKIDDIMIANNIANSANGETTESYHFWWSWQDKAHEIQRNLERERSHETSAVSLFSGVSGRVGGSPDGEPLTIFGMNCGPCSADTTKDD